MNLPNLFRRKPNTFDVSSVKYKKPVDQQLINKLIDYLQLSHKQLPKMGLSKIMVGIFETNSAVAATLLKKAVKDNVVALIFDFGTEKTSNLIAICNQLSLDAYILKRGKAYQAEVSAYHYHKPADIKKFYQRFINYHLTIAGDQMKTALVDTIDKSDRLLGIRPVGFYGHFMPFYSLYKSELFELANLLGVPTDKVQSYQDLPYPDNLVLTYEKIDPVLFLLTEKQLSAEEISRQFNIDLHWLKRLKSIVDKQLFQTPVSQFIISA